ncbi:MULTISPECIES: cytochrome c class I [Thiothrix]|jgi:sulfide dehydrogenase cytochrome subunit|uniref:Cytochrome c class I n=1 Tax=Thiothrix lacustris TaxID=525917 RepID=A0A1Y1QKV7_9GAMM|nr:MULTISPECIES: cytochrome c class I [Thiothrix]MDX9989150.1 cytochrome c class I [Thiothrix unzii]OQX08210.1 MAG: cytochrome c class I [Thiothrix lacustris]
MKRLLITTTVCLLLPAFAYANPATLNHPGRTLAANCFQCHGTDGYGMEHLAGERVSEIVDELQEMQFEPARKDIMAVHAQAYTAEEIKLIADYFSKQPK